MSKGYIISAVTFALVILTDFGSYREVSKDITSEKLNNYVNTELSYFKEMLSSDAYLDLFRKDSLDINDLNRIKALEERLEQNHIYPRVYDKGSLLYWKNGSEVKSFCKVDRVKDSLRISICMEVYDDHGELKNQIYNKSGIHHHVYKPEIYKATHSILDGISPIYVGERYRTVRLNNIILGFYLVGLLFLLTNFIRKEHHKFFAVATLARSLLYLVPWKDRFLGSPLIENIFQVHNGYSIIELLLDTFLISGLLILLSKYQFKQKEKISLPQLSSSYLFCGLLFLSHLRLTQLILGNNKLGISIDNLGNITVNDMMLFSVMLGSLSAIFIYITSFVLAVKKSYDKKILYTGFAATAIVSAILCHLLQLDIHPILYGFAMMSFFALLDLFIDIKNKTITWIIWWSIFFGVYCSAVLFNYDIKKDIKSRQDFLKEIFHLPDTDKIAQIKESGIINAISDEVEKLLTLPEEANYDKLDFNIFLSKELNLPDLIVDVFDRTGINIFNNKKPTSHNLLELEEDIGFDEIKNIVWFYDTISTYHRVHSGIPLTTLNGNHAFPYAYYDQGRALIDDIRLSKPELELVRNSKSNVIYQNSNAYIKHEPSYGKILITKKSFTGLVKPIALFSFLFCSIVILIFLLGFVNYFVGFLPNDWPFKLKNIDYLNSKIQISLILVILFSFFIIAIITSSFLKSFINEKNEVFVKEKLESIAKDLRDKTVVADAKEQTVAIAKNYESQIEYIHNAALDIFLLKDTDKEGDYFHTAYFSKQKNPKPFSDYTNPSSTKNFFPLQYSGEVVGYAAVQYNPGNSIRISVFDFLGSIFNVYVFLFLIASVLAIFIARSITKPLSILNQKISQVKLGKRNELIEWDKDDEIGTLINNYNNMVNQLEESAEILAKTERDSAWREMAKQVAHEIKNPLTPMRMYIQHLEKAIKREPHNAKAISQKISVTLMEQIDNLTQIANSFSDFAALPQTSNTKTELNSVIQAVHSLFRKREDMDISLTEPIDTIYVFADKNQLIRILNNLVKNAIESIPSDCRGNINLKLSKKGEKALIAVSDNGSGISDDMKSKIFQPKFTTKDSGSGLGLAISTNMLESMNGRLYFDSKKGQGSTFYIELDIIRNSSYEDTNKRITLD